ncbi:hypothetical protein TH47_18355 [Thalassospira sp. MCCC 1A02803]|nr:hypothetical protein AUQ41_09355 [Thalassospira sp. MCCC 1A02898]ONH86123.1 hypothetical protein TH47_18355 [Thalassospira sp. MCCC 1A02803]
MGKDRLAVETAKIMAEVHQNLGFAVGFLELTGRRRFDAFNGGIIVDELSRRVACRNNLKHSTSARSIISVE